MNVAHPARTVFVTRLPNPSYPYGVVVWLKVLVVMRFSASYWNRKTPDVGLFAPIIRGILNVQVVGSIVIDRR